jgi:hypothetical protein
MKIGLAAAYGQPCRQALPPAPSRSQPQVEQTRLNRVSPSSSVGNQAEIGGAVAATEEPADVRPPEAVAGRVRVGLGVGVGVVMAMVGGPPERPFLCG